MDGPCKKAGWWTDRQNKTYADEKPLAGRLETIYRKVDFKITLGLQHDAQNIFRCTGISYFSPKYLFYRYT
jgi:hypothetical protein